MKSNIEFAKELEIRTRKFSIDIIRLSSSLPNTPEAKVIRNQLTKSGTSIGANYRESNRSRSKADFKHKVNIVEAEASETQYWLDIIADLKWSDAVKMRDIVKECSELLAIFSSISKKLNK